jgi:hypothetical protein
LVTISKTKKDYQMKKNLLLAMSLSSAVLFSGCATVMSGETQKVNIRSCSPNQTVTIGDRVITTPAVITLKRDNKNLLIKSENSDDQYLLEPKINSVFWANTFSMGSTGSTTDYATGAMWKYDENVNLNCQK